LQLKQYIETLAHFQSNDVIIKIKEFVIVQITQFSSIASLQLTFVIISKAAVPYIHCVLMLEELIYISVEFFPMYQSTIKGCWESC